MPEEKVESVKGMTLTADGYSAVFDVQTEDLDAFLTGKSLNNIFQVENFIFICSIDIVIIIIIIF